MQISAHLINYESITFCSAMIFTGRASFYPLPAKTGGGLLDENAGNKSGTKSGWILLGSTAPPPPQKKTHTANSRGPKTDEEEAERRNQYDNLDQEASPSVSDGPFLVLQWTLVP